MQKPELNDALAKTKVREHKKFGGKVVEILYGAKDENGNPVMPKEGVADGHGRWYGIEINGDYRMFSWAHSQAEGGQVEYGSEYEENAVEVMENQLQQKWDLVRQAEEIARHGFDEEAGKQLAEIVEKYQAIKDWNTPVEKDRDGYDVRLCKAQNELAPRLEVMQANRQSKQAVVDQLDAIKEVTNFKEARNQISQLREQLNQIGSAGEEYDRQYTRMLNDLDREIRDKQKVYFDNRESNFTQAETTKKEIIEKTKHLVKNIKNYKQTADQLNTLFENWKACGSAGHDLDESLWETFNTERQKFYDAREKFFNERRDAFAKSVEMKNRLIAEAKELSAKNDFSKKITDRMKELDREWKAAGTSGKDNDALWDTFTAAKEVFWNGKQESFKKVLQADLAKKEAELSELGKESEDLEYKIEIAPNPSMREDAERQLSMNQDRAEFIAREIQDLKRRIAE